MQKAENAKVLRSTQLCIVNQDMNILAFLEINYLQEFKVKGHLQDAGPDIRRCKVVSEIYTLQFTQSPRIPHFFWRHLLKSVLQPLPMDERACIRKGEKRAVVFELEGVARRCKPKLKLVDKFEGWKLEVMILNFNDLFCVMWASHHSCGNGM